MDKMIQGDSGEVTITNDGATILQQMQVHHPAAKMLVDLSKSQDIEAGDGTTSVVVICGALLDACNALLTRGLHPMRISEAFGLAADKAVEILESVAIPVDLEDREALIRNAETSLSSKVISQYSARFAPIAVDAVLGIYDPARPETVDLDDIKVVSKVGGTMDDTELVPGLVFSQGCAKAANGPTRCKDAKIGVIQFHLSAPKTDIENQVVVSDYTAMDRILREERKYILKMCKTIKKAGCNVLLIQKSILRDAVNDLSLHFLAKLGIVVVRDVERDDIEFICKTIGAKPVADIANFTPEKLGSAEVVEEVSFSGRGGVVKITGVPNPGRTVSVLIRGSNELVVGEADRSLHDALCVVRSLVKRRFLLAGGGAPEVELTRQLGAWAKTLTGMESYAVKGFADALEVVPYTLAENAGMHPIALVTALRKEHAEGSKYAGINVKKCCISDMLEANVVQPLLVTLSAIKLATETVQMILKIDDLVGVR